MSFGNILLALRKDNLLTAKELSKKLNVSINLIYEWEKGRCEPSFDCLIKIAEFFGVSTDYLLGLEDDLGLKPMHTPPPRQAPENVPPFRRTKRRSFRSLKS